MADNKKHPALGGLSSSIKQEAELEEMRYKNDAALRSPHEDDADLFDDIGNSVSAPGQRPRGLGANLAAGVSKGLAYGSRSSATAEKKDKLGKHENVMKYIRESQAAITKQNQYYADQEKKLETVKPFAVGGLEVAYSGMDYNTGNERMRNIIEQAKLADPSIKGDYIGYVPNSPIVNLRNEKGDVVAYSLSNLVGEDVVKRIQGNYVEQQRLHTSQDSVEVNKYDKGIASGRYGAKMDDTTNQFGSVPLETLKKGGGARPIMASLNSEINLAKDIPVVLEQLAEAEDIIKNNPKIGTGWNNWASKGSFTKAVGMDKDLRHAYEKLDKIASRVEETYVKAKGSSITDAERETIRKGLFDSSLQGRSSKYNINSVRKELAIAAERGKFASEQLSKGLAATSESFNNYKKSLDQDNSGLPKEDDIWNQIGKSRQ